MNYEELVKALRICSSELNCGDCPLLYRDSCSSDQIMRDAAAAIEGLQAKVKRLQKEIDFSESTYDEFQMQAAVQNALLAKQLQKRGEWINHKDEHQCSVCRETVVVDEIRWEQIEAYDYCPNCGAKMTEVQE